MGVSGEERFKEIDVIGSPVILSIISFSAGVINVTVAICVGRSSPGYLPKKSPHTICTNLSVEESLSKLSLSDKLTVLKIGAVNALLTPFS